MRDSPQTMQVSRFAGSLTRQLGHSGRPWASRVAGSRRAPQRTHSSKRDLAMQLRQTRCPSSGLSMRTTRRQRGQAGRTIPATPAVVQQVDEPQDGAMRRQIALPGQQPGVVLQGPDHSLAIVGTVGCRPAEGFGDRVTVGARGDRGDQFVDDGDGITVVVVGTHRTAWQALAVPETDASDVSAGGALGASPDRRPAVPVLAPALEGSQRLAALGADRRRDRRGAGLAELDEQIADGPGRRGPAVGQDAAAASPGPWPAAATSHDRPRPR